MMTDELKSAIVMGVVLIALFVIGNVTTSSPHTLSVFPWLADLVAFPFVLYPAIRAIGITRHGASLTTRQGLLIGESISRWAALLFGVFAVVYGYVYFEFNGPLFALSMFVMTVLGTWLTGVAFSFLCALIVARSLSCSKKSSAA